MKKTEKIFYNKFKYGKNTFSLHAMNGMNINDLISQLEEARDSIPNVDHIEIVFRVEWHYDAPYICAETVRDVKKHSRFRNLKQNNPYIRVWKH